MRLIPVVFLTLASTATAQQQLPPVRPLGAVAAKAAETFTSPAIAVRALPGGKVLVHDQFPARRVLMLDATLGNAVPVADTTPATGNAYSGRMAGLLPFRADSSLFVDPQSLSMLVIDPDGKIGRTMSVPRSQDAMALVGLQGTPGLDASGRIVYRAAPNFRFAGGPRPAGGTPQVPEMPDSAAIVRIDLATRAVDTVTWIKTPKIRMNVNRSEEGRISMTSEINPLPIVDDWAVLSDGTIAILRGRDYRVEFIDPDGSRRPGQKIAFEWQRLTDEQKVAFIDSVKVARERQLAEARANAPVGTTGSAPAPMPMEGGMRIEMRTRAGGGGPPPSDREQRTISSGGPMANLNFVSPSELPDYRPAFFQGQVRADREGNLWVRTTTTKAGGGSIYDVINRKGELIDRVQVPTGRTILGFGDGGAVYLSSREGTTTILERASVR
jgi:hypothetical protein